MSSQGNSMNLLKQLPFYGRTIEPRIKESTIFWKTYKSQN